MSKMKEIRQKIVNFFSDLFQEEDEKICETNIFLNLLSRTQPLSFRDEKGELFRMNFNDLTYTTRDPSNSKYSKIQKLTLIRQTNNSLILIGNYYGNGMTFRMSLVIEGNFSLSNSEVKATLTIDFRTHIREFCSFLELSSLSCGIN
ncbi:hypothetical protein pv_50 [Pithovirus sibericum]|uniref:Uncharacterized protein n=1 Tax=Pithovirus sibericum TaxID=1450746 RepID=W5S5R6_9VIRU|nr:hypothetical protein pv_50 [Pithovirus sibericum]AHH01617.1 hypothetical protein pv_50 [Pithovirus sibericum]